MFVRRKWNKSGKISIQVVSSKGGGKYKVLRNFGVGSTEQELVGMEEQARNFIVESQGFVGELFEDRADVLLSDFVATFSNEQIRVVGPELIFGALYDKIGYHSIPNDMFRHLVISRLFSPGSKLKTIDYLARYQGTVYSIDKIYRFLDSLCFDKKKQEKRQKEAELAEKTDIKTTVEKITF
ncbi:MAG: hypothetical protein LBO74_09575 [Candidatus Symbiothrix sp.]|jgi:hypothetical protein|nr:hypothetical protein [Candidatus Symbiothrix sp.]